MHRWRAKRFRKSQNIRPDCSNICSCIFKLRSRAGISSQLAKHSRLPIEIHRLSRLDLPWWGSSNAPRQHAKENGGKKLCHLFRPSKYLAETSEKVPSTARHAASSVARLTSERRSDAQWNRAVDSHFESNDATSEGKRETGQSLENDSRPFQGKKIQRGWHLSYGECETLSQSKQTGSRSSRWVEFGFVWPFLFAFAGTHPYTRDISV